MNSIQVVLWKKGLDMNLFILSMKKMLSFKVDAVVFMKPLNFWAGTLFVCLFVYVDKLLTVV